MSAESVLVERAGPVATLTLNRPEVHNAFNDEVIARLKAAFDTLLSCYAQEVEKISGVRVAILDPGATRTQMRARASVPASP